MATETLNLDVETTALIKAAEDMMVLSRGIKEVWLRAPSSGIGMRDGEDRGEGREEGMGAEAGAGAREEDVRAVIDGLTKLVKV